MASQHVLRQKLQLHAEGLLFSYSQIFFARSRWYGALLLLASMYHPVIGLAGLLSVLISNLVADVLSLNRYFVHEGIFGFSSAMVGMGVATFFEPSLFAFVLLAVGAIFTVLFSLAFQGVLIKYQLPMLSLPFLFSFWLILLSSRYFSSLHPQLVQYTPISASIATQADQWVTSEFFRTYLLSLGAVFFQRNIIVGGLIALGLLLYSRIYFSLSLLGLFASYFFYKLAGIHVSELTEFLVGSNFMLAAIAMGGFYVIPNVYSYLVSVGLIPFIVVVHYGFKSLLGAFYLPAYTIAFTISLLLFLYLLRWRLAWTYLKPVTVQYCSAEKNLRHYLITQDTYRYANYYAVSLPYWGEWIVSQGHDGKITHIGAWSKAFDFVLLDQELRSYAEPGNRLEDYYCYGKPVLSPGDGTVVAVVEQVPENEIGDVNTQQNWGNSIVIHHKGGLYSELSHLKVGSVKVGVGEWVERGQVIAACGSSGRSPEPHLHFQLQISPDVGARTYDYPLASYIQREGNRYSLHLFQRPEEGQFVQNPEVNVLMSQAYYWIPGRKFQWKLADGRTEHWEVHTDEYNQTYVYSPATKSLAYFVNDGVIFHFTSFFGRRSSLLYAFYQASYHVFQGYYPGLEVEKAFAVSAGQPQALTFLLDFVAPFVQLTTSKHKLRCARSKGLNHDTEIVLETETRQQILGLSRPTLRATITLRENRIDAFEIKQGSKHIQAQCVS